MRTLLLVLVPPILLLLFAVLLMWVPLPPPFAPALSAARNRLSAIVTGTLGLAYLVTLFVWVITSFSQAGRFLDPVLAPYGLIAERYQVFGRRYYGEIRGRKIEVDFQPGYGVTRALLNVSASAEAGTRLAIVTNRPLLDCMDCVRVATQDPDLRYVEIYAQQEDFAQRLLSDPTCRETVSRLMSEQGSRETRDIYVQPGKIWVRTRPQQLNEQQFRQLLEDTLTLASTSEAALGEITP